MSVPVIELYEYQINGYEPLDRIRNPIETDKVFKFSNIDDSPDGECKRVAIDGYQTNVDDDTTKSSCDPIFSVGGFNIKANYDIDNLYGNYKLFIAKDLNVMELDESSKIKILENINKVCELQFKILDSNKNDTLKPLYKLFNKKYNDSDVVLPDDKFNLNINEVIDFAYDTSIIQTLNVTDETKIILFGDFHGSYHTFFRSLCRLHRYGILNLETFKINDPYKIIFLGDILDRGMYALDILNVIFKLIINNNTDPHNQKIIFNRGNHENYDQYEFKFLNFITRNPGVMTRVAQNDKSNPVIGIPYIAGFEFARKLQSDDLYNKYRLKLNKLFCMLPSAVIINNQNKQKYWCAHGGFSLDIQLSDDIFKLITITDISQDIRWSDFGSKEKSINFEKSHRGAELKKYTYRGTMEFLTRNNIDFIIRGHQDSIANSSLFQNNGVSIILAHPKMPDIPNIITYNKTPSVYGSRVYGPIARVIPNKYNYTDIIFPVLTISTNTDSGRDLNADSFVVLRFDITSATMEDFSKNTLSIMYSIKHVLTNKNINRDIIMKKNLETLLKILNIINDDTHLLIFTKNNILNRAGKRKFKSIIDISNAIMVYYDDLESVYQYYNNKFISLSDKFTRLKPSFLDIQQNLIEKFIKEINMILENIHTVKTNINEKINKYKTDSNITISFMTTKLENNNNQEENILDQVNKIIKEFEM
jgi:hypothetical protein